MINVINVKDNSSDNFKIYIGRGSILGNPFTHLKGNNKACFKVKTRDEAVSKYREWLESQMESQSIIMALTHIKEISLIQDVDLACYCKPLSCHGDIIKEFIELPLKWELNGDSIMQFGKWKGYKLLDIPNSYWKWLDDKLKPEDPYNWFLKKWIKSIL